MDGGQKQSKSLGNCVALTDSARDKFGKVMSLSDDLIIQWMEVYTEIDLGEIELSRQQLIEGKINPRDLKLELAAAIVARYADQEVASREKNWFLETFSSDKFPDDAPMIMLATEESDLMEVLKECLPQQSKSGLITLIRQGGVELDGEKILDPQFKIKIGSTSSQLRLGKKNFFRLMSE